MDIVDVCRMASTNPARKYSLGTKGYLAVDKDFDAVVIDDNYNVLKTYVEGRLVFDGDKEKAPFNEEFLKEVKID